jgi:hypothetical protein
MGKSITVTKKSARRKRGRPPKRDAAGELIGIGTQIGMRWPKPVLRLIDAWRAEQEGEPSRPEAIRALVELGLKK